ETDVGVVIPRWIHSDGPSKSNVRQTYPAALSASSAIGRPYRPGTVAPFSAVSAHRGEIDAMGDRRGRGRRSSAAVLAAALVVLAAGGCSDSVPHEAVDVDGRTLHLECTGDGSPTVVLQAGFGNAGDVWNLSE